jgi:hypothetical protein
MGYSFLEVPLCLSGVGPVQNDGRYGIYDGDIGHDICRLSQSESPQSTRSSIKQKRTSWPRVILARWFKKWHDNLCSKI